jgi:hypothetical protein
VGNNPQGTQLYGQTGLPAGLTLDARSGLVSGTIAYTAAESHGGNYTVTVTATNISSGATQNETFTWVVTDVNTVPVVTAPGNLANATGDGIALQIQATNADGNSLTYSASGLPAGLSLNTATGLISGTIPATAASTTPYAVTLTASDGIHSGSGSFNWTVSHVLLTSPGNQTNLVGDPVSVQVQAVDPDGDSLTYTASGLPGGLSINSQTGLISGSVTAGVNDTSPYQVTVSVSDGSSTNNTSFPWTVAHIGVTNPGAQTSAEGAAVSLPITATDTDGATLTFSAAGLPQGLTINSTSGLISGTVASMSANGSPYTVTVTAFAGQYSGSAIFSWSVTHVLLTNPGNKVNAQGNTVSLQVTGSDPDGDHLTYSATNLPNGLTINAGTGLISGTVGTAPAGSSPYAVTVSATDGSESTSVGFTWTVTNGAITLSNPGAQHTAEGGAVSLAVTGSDPDGDPLSYSASGLPLGLSIGITTGTISGTIDYSAVETAGGQYSVTVVADDGNGDSKNVQFAWTVTDTHQVPQFLSNPGPQSNQPGQSVSVWIDGYDPDGNALVYSATGLPAGLSIDSSLGQISGTIQSGAAQSTPYTVTTTINNGFNSNSESVHPTKAYLASWSARIFNLKNSWSRKP